MEDNNETSVLTYVCFNNFSVLYDWIGAGGEKALFKRTHKAPKYFVYLCSVS
jgi:hypothetical protein